MKVPGALLRKFLKILIVVNGGSKGLILSMGVIFEKDPSFGALRFRTRTRADATVKHFMNTVR